ncbi:hypothetical protein Y032_0088g2137 [Ancylostoma ceylanicum]|uniref:guanylate cyclase n=1 Tax=Ancylostoma ceylanicum TaxID=53326 RepID=A0A016TMT8_9BILA|nr:hypothetical protein Y032_0088g2137 [Ancylostoma ceylanicum]
MGHSVSGGAIGIALDRMKAEGIAYGFDFRFLVNYTECSTSEAVGVAVEFMKQRNVDVVIGPPCPMPAEIMGHLSTLYKKTMLGWGFLTDSQFSDIDKFPYITKVIPDSLGMMRSVLQLFSTFAWDRVAIFYTPNEVEYCDSIIDDAMAAFSDETSYYVNVVQKIAWDRQDGDYIRNQMRRAKASTRVIVMCLDTAKDRRAFMKIAVALDMVSDEFVYVFLGMRGYGFVSNGLTPFWEDLENNHADDQIVKEAAKRILTVDVNSDDVDAAILKDFMSKAVPRVRQDPLYCSTPACLSNDGKTVAVWARYLHDVFYLYGLSLNESLTLDPVGGQSNASTLAQSMKRSFLGLTGAVTINENGTRVPLFTVYGLDVNYNQVAYINFTLENNQPVMSKGYTDEATTIWATRNGKRPLSRPICGYSGTECPKDFWDQYSIYVAIGGAIVGIFVIAAVLLFVYLIRVRRLEKEQLRLQWQIPCIKLRKPPSLKELQQLSKRSLQSGPSTITADSRFASEMNFGHFEVYFLDKEPVLTTKHAITGLTQEDYARFPKMRKLDQDNVNRFIGLSIDGPEYVAIWRMCQRGTLQELISKGSLWFDPFFMFCIMRDIAEGLRFLHTSFLGCHGRLRSGCCLVNESWQVKISDYGTESLMEEERLRRKRQRFLFVFSLTVVRYIVKGLLWMAPEHLRDSSCSKEGDVYSFAIISSEVITRREAWSLHDRKEGVDELVYMIKKGGSFPLRPDLSTEGEINNAMLHLIRDCWSEKPSDRPTADTICKLLKSMMPDKKTNLMDHMFNMLEDYTTTLELDVEERTKQLQEEKKKADILLGRMLPRRLSNRERLTELQEALRGTYVDILAVTELRWRGTGCMDLLDSEYRFFYAGPEDVKAPSGTGFLVSKRMIPFIEAFQRETDRISRLDLRVGQHVIRCLSIYAPPSSCAGFEDEEDYSRFLEELQVLLHQPSSPKLCSDRQGCSNESPQVHLLLLGDFNAKIGVKENETEVCVGPFGSKDGRNARGQLVVEFCEGLHLRAVATFFKTRSGRKWTWKSPDGSTRNCIDHILACRHIRFNSVRTGSLQFETDHRLLRGTLQWPKSSFKSKQKPRVRHYVDRDIFEHIMSNNCPKTLTSTRNGYDELCTYIRNAATLAERPLERRSCLSNDTVTLMKHRQQLKKTISTALDRLVYTETCKMLRRQIREDIRFHHCQIVQKAVQSRKSLRQIRHETAIGHHQLFQLKDGSGEMCRTKADISRLIKQFYEELYTSKVDITYTPMPVKDECLPFLEDEVDAALKNMKGGRTPGHDRITIEMVKWGSRMLIPLITELFNQCLHSGKVPENMADSLTILLHKKGDPSQLKNYRPISLLSVLYKLLTKVISKRVERVLDAEQPREQAGFRKNYSTIDHLHAINELIERCSEYRMPLYIAFIDYEKAFDTVETNSLWNVLQEQGVQSQLITLLRGIYASAQSMFKVGETTIPVKICRGVRQGDTISPKLFIATLEHVFRKLSWNDFGLAVNGNFLTNLRFADDVVLLAKSAEELQTMIDELDEHSLRCGLKISTAKTKIMATAGTAISLRGTQLECVESFLYLGQRISLNRDFSEEIARRIRAGWSCFHRYEKFMSSRTVEMKYKRALFNMCILPAMLYGAETWVLTKTTERKLACAQRRMERFMVGVRLLDKKTNAWLRGVTKVKDAVSSARERKWAYGWELAMSTNVKWSRELVEWRPPLTRPAGRPKARWRDEFQKVLGTCNWQLIARAKTKKEWIDLTRQVADRLKLGQTVEPEGFDCVTVFFSDVVKFTQLAAKCSPFQVVSLLNDLYGGFDSIIEEHCVYKVESIGDGYLCVSGLPTRNGFTHIKEIAELSLSFMEFVGKFRITSLPRERVQLRIGVNTGKPSKAQF